MAALTITPGNVVSNDPSGVDRKYNAGVTVTAGQVVYLDAATTKWLLADNNSATVAARGPAGIALNGASNNQPLAVQRSGDVVIGATLVAGSTYYLDDTPGAIATAADLLTGEYPSIIGIAKSTTVLNVDINSSGVALP